MAGRVITNATFVLIFIRIKPCCSYLLFNKIRIKAAAKQKGRCANKQEKQTKRTQKNQQETKLKNNYY